MIVISSSPLREKLPKADKPDKLFSSAARSCVKLDPLAQRYKRCKVREKELRSQAVIWPFTGMAQWVVGIALSDMIHTIVLSCTFNFLSHSFSLTKLRWTCTPAIYISVCGGANAYLYVH